MCISMRRLYKLRLLLRYKPPNCGEVLNGESLHARLPLLQDTRTLASKFPYVPIGAAFGHRKGRRLDRKPVHSDSMTKTLSFSHDVLWERVSRLQKRALVGKWIFAELSEHDMQNWVKITWEPILGYAPQISILMNSWFSVHFLHMENAEKILRISWVWARSFLHLHKWYIGFNPLLDAPKNEIVWGKLPRLPIEFWTTRALTEIGNAIGRFIYINPKVGGARDKQVA